MFKTTNLWRNQSQRKGQESSPTRGHAPDDRGYPRQDAALGECVCNRCVTCCADPPTQLGKVCVMPHYECESKHGEEHAHKRVPRPISTDKKSARARLFQKRNDTNQQRLKGESYWCTMPVGLCTISTHYHPAVPFRPASTAFESPCEDDESVDGSDDLSRFFPAELFMDDDELLLAPPNTPVSVTERPLDRVVEEPVYDQEVDVPIEAVSEVAVESANLYAEQATLGSPPREEKYVKPSPVSPCARVPVHAPEPDAACPPAVVELVVPLQIEHVVIYKYSGDVDFVQGLLGKIRDIVSRLPFCHWADGDLIKLGAFDFLPSIEQKDHELHTRSLVTMGVRPFSAAQRDCHKVFMSGMYNTWAMHPVCIDILKWLCSANTAQHINLRTARPLIFSPDGSVSIRAGQIERIMTVVQSHPRHGEAVFLADNVVANTCCFFAQIQMVQALITQDRVPVGHSLDRSLNFRHSKAFRVHLSVKVCVGFTLLYVLKNCLRIRIITTISE